MNKNVCINKIKSLTDVGAHKGAGQSLPKLSELTQKTMETKKTWEYVSRVLIPAVRPSHCPLMKISNVKPAHASDDISTHHGAVPRETITLTTYIRKDYTPIVGEYTLLYIKREISRREI